ncbi:MAG: methyl-accepting chemotaxis protein [Polyangiales bacterium]|nr:methyl-accepting chemotaxis protein [Myxococcales bacterium]
MTTRESAVRVSTPPKRQLRNFLLDPRFQLKYTTMVVVVTAIVASIGGYFVFQYSQGQTESMMVQLMADPSLDPSLVDGLVQDARNHDRDLLVWIITGIVAMVVTLGFTGIVITHKMAGPVFKMKRLLREVAAGDLSRKPGLRKGDELQSLFQTFSEMVDALRERQRDTLVTLDELIKTPGASNDAKVRALRDRVRASLGDPPEEGE